jgi:hypothetical protein
MDAVSEVLANGGNFPADLLAASNRKSKWTRSKGVKLGLAWFLIGTFFLLPLAAAITGGRIPGFLLVLGFMGGLLMMILSAIFLPSDKKRPVVDPAFAPAQPIGFTGPANLRVLPPEQSIPVSAGHWRTPDTNELAEPHSVVDNTTKLFKE